MERPQVQILVLVANSRMRNSTAEGEKGSMRTVLVHGLVDPKAMDNSDECDYRSRKGTQLIFWDQNQRVATRNTPEDACARGEESFLFFLTAASGS